MATKKLKTIKDDLLADTYDSRKGDSLFGERWVSSDGHDLSFRGVVLFAIVLFYRPHELTESLGWTEASASLIAIATIVIFLPSQLLLEHRLTIWTTEVKCAVCLLVLALLTIPLAIDPALAIETLQNLFVKVVIVFVILTNTVRTQANLSLMIKVLIGAGVLLSYQSIDLYQKGVFAVDDYRVSSKSGLLSNPNDMALFLLLLIPIAIGLGCAAKNRTSRILWFLMSVLMSVCVFLTYSRGGFLGFVTIIGILVWKLGYKRRLTSFLISILLLSSIIAFAPGNYNKRMLSIFDADLDVTGSSSERSEALTRSLIVTMRNPQGIGIGNSRLVSPNNRETHNAYTQVSAELGLLGIAAYLVLLISPLRKLFVLEQTTRGNKDVRWTYYMSIGLQASIGGFLVTSFFASVAYNYYIYYPIAFAIVLRRIFACGDRDAVITNLRC